jgi:hypothetical protein
MTSTGYKFGHYKIVGNPPADWSHAAAYLTSLYEDRESGRAVAGDLGAEQDYKKNLVAANGVSDLNEDDFATSQELAAADGVDISYFPGGTNYRATLASSANPLGLPGDLWALVGDAEEGALVGGLMRTIEGGEVEVKFPDGHDWQPLSDPSVISDFNIVGVNPESVQLFKNYDRDNTLGVISSYPLSDTGPFPTMEQLQIPMSKEIPEPRTEDDPYWETSGETHGNRPLVASVVVNSSEDLQEAIAAAVYDPDLRWYVERRIKSLGLEAALPWLRD